ncbi:MAG: hypothetical protein JEY97_16485 [Bacteroidales bacterium]|nr:hypothetical protein [Bacteroidales bacterium]
MQLDNPLKFVEIHKTSILVSLMEKNGYSKEKAITTLKQIEDLIKLLSRVRVDETDTEIAIKRFLTNDYNKSIKKPLFSYVSLTPEQYIIAYWILKAIRGDDTYVYANNYLAIKYNREVGREVGNPHFYTKIIPENKLKTMLEIEGLKDKEKSLVKKREKILDDFSGEEADRLLKQCDIELEIVKRYSKSQKDKLLLSKDVAKIVSKSDKYDEKIYQGDENERNKPKLIKSSPEIKPVFKIEVIETIYDILKPHFPNQEDELLAILKTGNLPNSKLCFHGNGKTLLDFFKQLIKGQLLIITVQRDFETWISDAFEFFHKRKPNRIVPKYASKVISGNERAAKGNRLIDVINENGKFKIKQLEIRNREQN